MEDASTNTDAPTHATVPTLELLGRTPITYEDALKTNANMIHEAGYVAATKALYVALWSAKPTLEALTRHHLGLNKTDICTVARPIHWIRGGFNVCIPVEVQSPSSCRKFMMRCAMPHKLSEDKYPGTVDEKMACEVGTYVWVQEKCRDIPIPHLYGFGFSDHRRFTHEAHRPWYTRVMQYIRRIFFGLVGYPGLLSHYTSHTTSHRLPAAYMLLDHVGSGTSQMLSVTWAKQRGDPTRRRNLFRGMSRVTLSLARIPQPQIGSFRFHHDGTINLTNRPLTCTLMLLENDGTPRTIPPDKTYPSIEPYIADLFHSHDQRLLSHPNAVYDAKDCRGELAAKVLLRALAHRYIRPDRRNGPFFLQLDDLHASNIFVDDDWNVTALVDLEWICARCLSRG